MTRSLFITLDGIDGVGKSTQIERLASHLTELGHDVLTVRDPGTTDVGVKLREILLDSQLEMHRRTEAMLFMASRCEMIESVIRPSLLAGKTVISDRFLLSTVVYQSVGGNVPAKDLWHLGRLANDSVRPDLTILLDMSAAESIKRMKGPADRMEKRGAEYLESVRQAFLQQLPESSEATEVIDASQTADEVANQIRNALESRL